MFVFLRRAIRVDSEQEWNLTHCRTYKGRVLQRKQFRICKRNLPIMKFVSEAVENTVHECQKQMANRRWNCSTVLRAPKFLKDLTGGKLMLVLRCDTLQPMIFVQFVPHLPTRIFVSVIQEI